MTVYVVTKGSYSDYHICGIFSTEELAKKKKKNGEQEEYDEYCIEEWGVDELSPLVVGNNWWCGIMLDGSVGFEQCNEDCEYHQNDTGDGSTNNVIENEESFLKYYCSPTIKNNSLFIGSSVISAEHAKKLAIEQRQKFIREHNDLFVKGMKIWNEAKSPIEKPICGE